VAFFLGTAAGAVALVLVVVDLFAGAAFFVAAVALALGLAAAVLAATYMIR
jgi:hypothetical protein